MALKIQNSNLCPVFLINKRIKERIYLYKITNPKSKINPKSLVHTETRWHTCAPTAAPPTLRASSHHVAPPRRSLYASASSLLSSQLLALVRDFSPFSTLITHLLSLQPWLHSRLHCHLLSHHRSAITTKRYWLFSYLKKMMKLLLLLSGVIYMLFVFLGCCTWMIVFFNNKHM